jgi:chromosome segregation protein
MRLLTLDLLRYGHLSDVRIDFPADAALTVVLGANEAGKSTALSAIGDALFGFPERSPFAFLHQGTALRIGFTLAARDGLRGAFIRRKGRRDTLLDSDGTAVPEEALLRLMGGADRKLFETAHGLDSATLRRGAEALLGSGGEAGESLLAGMGLPHLRHALKRLDDEAKALHGDGRGRRALSVATEAWNEARRQAEEAAIRPREWAEAEAALADIRARIEADTTAAAALAAEAARLQRLRRVLPILAPLARQRQEVALVADAPRLPADAATRLAAGQDALRQGAEDARREAAEAERLRAERDAIAPDAAVLALQDRIDALAAQRVAMTEAERDLPGVLRQVAGYRAAVAEAAGTIGSEAPPEALRDALPSPAARDRAQKLIRRRTEYATALRSAEDALREATRRRDLMAAQLAAAPAPPAAGPLKRAIEAAQAEGKVEQEWLAAERALAAATAQASAALAALPLWSGDAAALAACPLPLRPMAEEAATRLQSTGEALDAARRAAATLAAEVAALEEAVEHLARGEVVPTRDVIAAARARRDAAWAAFRDGAADEAPRYETLRDEADRLADARADDAQRVNDYAAKQARLALLRGRQAEAAAAIEAAGAAATAAQAAWAALWSPAGITPDTPAAMAEWRRAREEVLRLAALEAEARARRDGLAERRDQARAALRPLLPGAAPDASLSALLALALDAMEQAEAAAQAHRRLSDRLAQGGDQVTEAQSRLRAATADLAGFEPEWGVAAQALSLPEGSGAEAVEAALGAWTRIAEAARAWRNDEARVAAMQAALSAFGQEAAALGAAAGEAAEAPSILAARLARRLAEARLAAGSVAALGKRIAERDEAVTKALARQEAARAALRDLGDQAGTEEIPALEEAIRRAAARDALAASVAGLEAELLRQGDGQPEEALRAEAEAVDPDQAAARIAAIEAEQAALRDRLTASGAARQEADSRRAALEAGRDAAAHAQEARHHLAEAQHAAERYARLHVARTLLQAGIERIRQESQGPLLRAASAHFAQLTEGRYAGLTVDEDEARRTLIRARRGDGSECPVDGLSEGTRDQLFLALRVAAVEAQAARAEPLPFIADDLLATFDDRRASAGLALLAGLGATTQAILFTHHAHLAALAARLPGVVVRELPSPEGMRPAA